MAPISNWDTQSTGATDKTANNGKKTQHDTAQCHSVTVQLTSGSFSRQYWLAKAPLGPWPSMTVMNICLASPANSSMMFIESCLPQAQYMIHSCCERRCSCFATPTTTRTDLVLLFTFHWVVARSGVGSIHDRQARHLNQRAAQAASSNCECLPFCTTNNDNHTAIERARTFRLPCVFATVDRPSLVFCSQQQTGSVSQLRALRHLRRSNNTTHTQYLDDAGVAVVACAPPAAAPPPITDSRRRFVSGQQQQRTAKTEQAGVKPSTMHCNHQRALQRRTRTTPTYGPPTQHNIPPVTPPLAGAAAGCPAPAPAPAVAMDKRRRDAVDRGGASSATFAQEKDKRWGCTST